MKIVTASCKNNTSVLTKKFILAITTGSIILLSGCDDKTYVSGANLEVAPFTDVKEVYRHLDKAAAAIYVGTDVPHHGLLGSAVVLSKKYYGERKFALLTNYHVASNILLSTRFDDFKIGVLMKDPSTLRRVKVNKNEITWVSNDHEKHDMTLGDITDLMPRFSLERADIKAVDLDCIGSLSESNIPNVLSYTGVATTNTYPILKVKQPFAHFVAICAEERNGYPKSYIGRAPLWMNPFNHISGCLVAMFVDKPVEDCSSDHHIVHCFRYPSNHGNSGGGVYVVTEEYEPYLIGILRGGDTNNWMSSVLPIDHIYALFDKLYGKEEIAKGDTEK